ncbi:MAG: fliL [Rhizobacter sp.]|jgi:flagellar FliL protein|nr:fliL [Rhizobacter sp.]
MKKVPLLICLVLGAVLLTSAGGAGAWWYFKPKDGAHDTVQAKARPPADKTDYKYISLDKVIVMLRSSNGEPMAHYLAIDLVFKSSAETERITKEQLPLLRSVAVRALSLHTLETAGRLSIDQLTAQINEAYNTSYETDQREKPFSEAMIGKLVIE